MMPAIDVKVILGALEVTVDPILRKHLSMALRRATKLYTCDAVRPRVYTRKDRLTTKEIETGRCVSKIQCIKDVRERTGLGLKDSKDLVEAEFDRLGYNFKPYPFTYNY